MQSTETRWEASQERRRDVTMATSSTSVFSSSSSSSFTSYNTHHQSSSSAFQCSTATSSTSSKTLASEDHMVVLSVPPALPAKRRQRANRLPSQYDNVDQADCATSSCSSLAGFMAVKQEETYATICSIIFSSITILIHSIILFVFTGKPFGLVRKNA